MRSTSDKRNKQRTGSQTQQPKPQIDDNDGDDDSSQRRINLNETIE